MKVLALALVFCASLAIAKSSVCDLPLEPGSCSGVITRWGFENGKCQTKSLSINKAKLIKQSQLAGIVNKYR